MELRAAEISSILKEQIANFGAEADVADVQRGRCRSQQLQQLCAVTAPGRSLVCP